MNYNLKLKEGEVTLTFSMFFLNNLCKLAKCNLSEVFSYAIGTNIKGEGDTASIDGGLMNDLEVRANVLASAVNATNGNTDLKTFDGFNLIESMESPLLNAQWADVYKHLLECIIPDSLPKSKKKAVKG